MCTSFIRRHIFKLPKNQIFTTRDVLMYGRRWAVDQALYRLVKAGVIIRLVRGVFVRDDSIRPSELEIARIKAQSFNKQIIKHARDLAAALKLVDEPNPDSAFHVNGRSSSFRFGAEQIRMQGMCPRKMILADTKAGQAMLSLWHLGQDACNIEQIRKATNSFERTDRAQIPLLKRWLPAWLSDYFGSGNILRPIVQIN